ncbi:glycosyltransferase family 4 protein [Maioricimonas sp. JC845]|uniref:glycosyltransferase family 4 protein n=1 Tax=Maioricimonas sp. JC845 TaxID=3232138 RepID=UPI00345ACE39
MSDGRDERDRPLRVAHLITRLIVGGAQENTLHTVEDEHRLHGDDVSLITGPGIGPEGTLEPRARAGGFPLHILPKFGRSIHPLHDWNSTRQLTRLLRDIRPDVVHTHSSKAGIIGRYVAERLRIPAVHTVHGASFHYGQHPLAYRTYVKAERWAARRTARFICVADAMTDDYVAAGIAPREQFVTIYSGFDVEPFVSPPRPREDVRRELGLEPHHVVIGKVARLFHLKGHEFVLQAAVPVIRANPDVRFVFVGDGLRRQEFEDWIARHGLTEHFRFTGLVPPTQVPELIHAMDVVVHTSQWEGLARVLPQGLIAGKPVVSYDVGGAREVVIPGQTGYLLPRDSVDELVEALLELSGNADLRTRLGQTGRERFTEQFRHQYMTSRIREVYQQVLEATHPNRRTPTGEPRTSPGAPRTPGEPRA